MPQLIPGHMQKIGGGGRGTASAIPGGIFGIAADAQVRDRLDGASQFKGRANSSSIAGGIFGDDGGPQDRNQGRYNPTQSTSQQGGPLSWDHGNSGPGYQPKYSAGGYDYEGAAGGKSTNAGQVRDGHFRGALNQESHTTLGRPAVQQRPPSNPPSAPSSARSSGFDLDMLSSAEQRDEDDRAEMLVMEAAMDQAMIEEAAAQIADEQGLDEMQEYNLIQQLRANLQQKARVIEEQNSARQQAASRQQQQQILSMGQQQRVPMQPMASSNVRPDQMATFGMEAAKQRNRGDNNIFSNNAFHSSTKVLAPPGGASSISFG
jgi:hypothetical protein